MALQDLTPQLRTRLSRMERAVGWFLIIAIGLLAFGFCYYLYNTARARGWFLTKARYYTFVKSADGLRVGDPVRLMGFDAGRIIEITPMSGDQFTYNVFVEFELKDPNYDYMWTIGSVAKVAAADFLGKRSLEVTKGSDGYPTYTFHPLREVTLAEAQVLGTNWVWAQEFVSSDGTLLAKARTPIENVSALRDAGFTNAWVMDMTPAAKRKTMTGMWNYQSGRYEPYRPKKVGSVKASSYWLEVDESPAVTERLEGVVRQVEEALPGILTLTNQLSSVLNNTDTLVSNLNVVATQSAPLVNNLAAATAQLDRPGALGEWLVPTNISRQLETTLGTANTTLGAATGTLESANTNLTVLVANLSRSLDNIASMTSNLNQQVEANTNIVAGISDAIRHADELVQGLKRHWLLRSAFKEKKSDKDADSRNEADRQPAPKLRSPKQKSR